LALLNSDFLNEWYGKNTKMKGNMREYYFTPLSKVPIRKIDFSNDDEATIHSILGGIYTNIKTDDKKFHFDEITRTYIKQKGLTDLYITLKNKLYELKRNGFEFDPESIIEDFSKIKANLFLLANFLTKNNIIDINYIKDVMLYYPSLIKDHTLYSFNSSEKAEVKSMLNNCTYFIKTTTKDFIIKNVKSDRLNSLFNDSGGFDDYGFECSFDLITNDNKIIEVESKTQKDASYLVELVKTHLKKSKLLSYETLLTFPIKNAPMEEFIKQKQSFIFESLSPLNEKLMKRLDEIFSNREIESLNKINNLQCIKYLINKYINFLYKKE